MIKRDKYLKQLISAQKNGFPKIITGIRRCGKSFLLKEIYREYLINSGVQEKNILVMELDDDRNSKYRDPIALGEYVREYCKGKGEYFVFIDEIQKVYKILNPVLTEGKHVLAGEDDEETISFVDVVLGLSREKNIDLYVTGSNSKMLSSDIVTEFRDKATNIALAPLSFEEYFEYVGGSATDAIYSYMQYGGMPLAVLKSDEERKEYLKRLFQTTYFSDIVERNNLKKGEALDELCNIISSSTGSLLNAEKIANTFVSVRHEKINRATVENYIEYFKDAFLLREASRYDLKGRKEIGALRKYYFCDTGLRNARLNFAFPDEGQMLENIVYNELCYNSYTVNVGAFDSVEKDKNGKSVRKTNEVDFYATKGVRSYYIQVTSDISNADTRAREVRPYILLNDQVQKILVINRPINETRDEQGFTVIGITDFLLRFIK
ncbi:ATP-binding protein [Butyrivibrio sp. WCD2001]|uniref:ATP-binding protein n=1 Tax=Butyrivibrio sp. WCD2001 TaxID=1280681 RepID=UPI000414EF3E|nr:ATP-binding protein [Butyrivibrio sp. WCD2001]